MRLRFVVPLLGTVISCSGGTAPARTEVVPEDELVGRIIKTGTPPMIGVTLLLDDGSSFNLRGESLDELGRLSGVRVGVNARPAGMNSLEVLSYRIVSVHGRTPWVGDLIGEGSRVYLLTGSGRIEVTPPPPGFHGEAILRVWILGEEVDGVLQLQSYGVIKRIR
ncbi:MAG: hypothetical protein ACE5FJ_12395 [Gemmatimonadales bacterium]